MFPESDLGKAEPFPALGALHERHYGLTKELEAAWAQAAEVCLSRHHESPAALTVSTDGSTQTTYGVRWSRPDRRIQGAWNNRPETTEMGAYWVALAAAEAHLGLVAVERAEAATFADYYVAPTGTVVDPDGLLDLEEAYRFEVTGMDACESKSDLYARLRSKIAQVSRGRNPSQAWAAVVAFSVRRVEMRRV